MKKLFLLTIIISFLFSFSYAQNVGIGTNNPNPNAALDIQSDSRGLLIPRMDSNARKAIAHVKGLLVYDTTTSSFWFSNGIGWLKSMASNGRQNLIEDGSNPGEMLYWNGTRWVTVDAGQQNQLLYFCNGAPTWGGCKPVISTSDITSITTATATGGGNITNEGTTPVTARGIVWSTTENPTVDLDTKTNDGSGTGSFTSNISGLSINTTYYVRSYAINANGTAYGQQVSFTTPNVDITTGLVGYWPFNGNANDESGNGNNGTVNGATLTTDRFGNANKAYIFDGNSNYIKSPTNQFPNSSRTISFWVTSDDYSQKAIVGFGGDGSCGTSFLINTDMISCDGANKIVMHNHCCINAFSADLTLMQTNKWNHIVYTLNQNGSKFYINGILVSSNSTGIFNTPIVNSDFGIGCVVDYAGKAPFVDVNANYFKGKLDDIRIYNRALTQEEITYLATH